MRHFWGDSDKEFYGIRWYNTVIQSLTSIVHFISLSSGDGCQYAAYICPPPKKKVQQRVCVFYNFVEAIAGNGK